MVIFTRGGLCVCRRKNERVAGVIEREFCRELRVMDGSEVKWSRESEKKNMSKVNCGG